VTALFTPLQSKRVYERVAAHLREMIGRGEFRPGDRLPAERDLAAQFGVSRPSVREALIVLETAGLIDVRAGDASYVNARRLGEICIPLDALDALSCGALEQLEAGTLLEVELAGNAALRNDRLDIPHLAALLDASPKRHGEGSFPAPLTRAFHEAVANESGNSMLASLAIGLWQMRCGRAWDAHRPALLHLDEDTTSIAERHRLLAALQAGSKRDARAAMGRIYLAMRELIFG
jgi:DNA-binding FadR family transcriptional regulator